jgi:hypothetical protein
MFGLNRLTLPILTAATMAFAAGMAGAATCTVTSDTGQQNTYTVEFDVSAGCYAVGNGNVNGSAENDPLLTGSDTVNGTIDYVSAPIDDLAFIAEIDDWTQVEGGGQDGIITGTIDIDSLGAAYEDLVLAIKFGNDWVSFLISGDDNPFTYSIDPKQGGGVSHVNLYGVPVAPIPVPAAGLLLLGGLGALGLARRRRKA